MPPRVEPDVSSVSGVVVGLEELGGKETGLARVTVVLPGAPVSDRRSETGSAVVDEPEDSVMVTV